MSDVEHLILNRKRRFPGNYFLYQKGSAILSPIINKIESIYVVVGEAWHTCPKGGMGALVGGPDYHQHFYFNNADDKQFRGLTTSVPAWCVALLRHQFTWARFGEEGQFTNQDFVHIRDVDLLRRDHRYFKQGVALLKKYQGSKEKLLAGLAEIRLTDGDYDVRQTAQIALEWLA